MKRALVGEDTLVVSILGVAVGHSIGGHARSLSCNCARGLQQVQKEAFGLS